jgi:D-alanine-D-alanine ligase
MNKIQKDILVTRRPQDATTGTSENETAAVFEVLSNSYENVSFVSISGKSDVTTMASLAPDLIFAGTGPKFYVDHNCEQNRAYVTNVIEDLGLTCTGSSGPALVAEANKQYAKQKIQAVGVPTASFFMTTYDDRPSEAELEVPFPLFLKPYNTGGGLGIDANSVVRNMDEFTQKLKQLNDDFNRPTLVEQYLPGREFTVGILKDPNTGAYDIMPLEIVVKENSNGDRVAGRSVKKADEELVVAVADSHTAEILKSLAFKAFEAMSGRDYGRIDIRMDEHGVPHFIESNLRPGISGGYFYRACKINKDISYEEMILRIAKLGLARA